jgi:hypothetical protein
VGTAARAERAKSDAFGIAATLRLAAWRRRRGGGIASRRWARGAKTSWYNGGA